MAAGLLFTGSVLATPLTDEMLSSLQSAYARAVAPGEQADQHRELFATVLQRVQRSYAKEADFGAAVAAAQKALEALPPAAGNAAEVFRTAVNRALRTLDPYSRYLDARAHGQERSESSGSFSGLGLQVEAGEGAVRVIAPMAGSPAERAGLQAGDLIVEVDGQPLSGVPLGDAIAMMRGAPGTSVALTVRRSGGDFSLSLTRETIRRQVLRWSMEGDALVLQLGSFVGPVAYALHQAIAEATAAHDPRAVVLDLRGNPGGLLREAVIVADAFLREGDIVSLRGRTAGNQRSWQADAIEYLAGVPMVVLIDGRSASAAELVAAALQENGRAKVMGQRSFGKGTVQSTFSLGGDRGALKLTTAYYHGPSGRSVQEVGVMPDIELAAGSASAAAGQQLAAGARLDPASCPMIIKKADPALACAIGYARSGNAEAFIAAPPVLTP